ncbi:MAG: 50S ribosomal protein L21 [Oscillospiraceae bacterium]|nr:50S ribosomal protein L21 [Oscillospiraceae bacterium]MBQ3048382.1 50S ribosomal protein L21 [Oscillospiraceae bacterium]MBQ9938858.1 50S ribosomal protein L21 [Oscillospiraceae bacterium]
MYAVIETGGKQYRVSEGDIVFIEKLEAEAGSDIVINNVVAVGKEDGIVAGAPYVEGASVNAKVIKNGKNKKVVVFTYRSKKDSKRKKGHRQPYTKIQIMGINA